MIEVSTSAAERGKRDLYFFANEILGYKDMVPRVHGPVCNLYVKKDPTKPVTEQHHVRNRLLLDPRGHFKTSISIADTLQWQICFPNITMLRMSGTQELVKRTIQEMRDHYLTNTTFRELYPESVPDSLKEWGDSFGFTVPNRTAIKREPTMSISTLGSVKAGSHFDVMGGDDLVNEINYKTKESLQKTITDWNLSRPLLNPKGFRQLEGTRYDWSDLYGNVIEKNKGQWLILCRAAWEEDTQGRKQLLFPERWSIEELEEIQREDPYLFSCQFLNNPIPSDADHFPMDLLVKSTLKPDIIPGAEHLNIFLTWDLGYRKKETSNHTVGAVGGFDRHGRLFIIDVVAGRFHPSELIDFMISVWRKWPVQRMGIEDAGAQRMLEPGLKARMMSLGLQIPIDWLQSPTNSEDVKLRRILALEPLLRQQKLFFNSKLPFLQALYTQFSRFPKYAMDDIPDAISRLLEYQEAGRSGVDVGQIAYGGPLTSLSWDPENCELGAGIVG